MRKILLKIVMTVTIASCSQKKGTVTTNELAHSNGVIIEMDKSINSLNSVVDSLEFIPLELTDESQIGKIDKILITDQGIFILDKKIAEAVFAFDHQGHFLWKISAFGNGPGEYNQLNDFDIIGKDIFLLDIGKTKVIRYNINGKYVGERTFGFLTTSFASTSSSSFVFSQGNRRNTQLKIDLNYNLIGWTTDSETLERFFPYTKVYESNKFMIPTLYNLFRSNNKLYYIKPWEYGIYEIGGVDSIKKSFTIDFGKKAIKDAFYEPYRNTNDMLKLHQTIMKSDFAHRINNFYEFDNKVIFNFNIGKTPHWASYDLETKRISVRNVIEMPVEEYSFLSQPSGAYENRMVSIYDIQSADYVLSKLQGKVIEDENLKYLSQLDKNSNPIIILSSLK